MEIQKMQCDHAFVGRARKKKWDIKIEMKTCASPTQSFQSFTWTSIMTGWQFSYILSRPRR